MLGVSPSGDSAGRARPRSHRAEVDAKLIGRIQTIHARSRGIYGAPRGHGVSRTRVARLMRVAAAQGVSRRRGGRTTRRDEAGRPAPDLVARTFTAAGPDRLWVADITSLPTWAGVRSLAVVLDVWSRRVIGWAMATPCDPSWSSTPSRWPWPSAARPR